MARRFRSIGLVAATALVTLVVHGAFAATTQVQGSTPSRVKVLRAPPSQIFSTTSGTFSNVPGARMKITVPSGAPGLVIVRFTGQAGCESGIATAFCSLRIFVGGKQAQPKTKGAAFIFVGATSDGQFGSYATERSRGGLSPGTYTVRVQWRTTSGADFSLENWHLTAEVFRQ